MELKNGLHVLHEHLGELEDAARGLENQNFADILKNARGKLQQLTEHADLEAVSEKLRTKCDGGPFGGKPAE